MITGRAYEVDASTDVDFSIKGYMQLVAGRTYRATASVRQSDAPKDFSPSQIEIGFHGMNSDFLPETISGEYTPYGLLTRSVLAHDYDGWIDIGVDLTISDNNRAAYARQFVHITGNDGAKVQIRLLKIEDVTLAALAEGSATASAKSATLAETFADSAGQAAARAETAATLSSSIGQSIYILDSVFTSWTSTTEPLRWNYQTAGAKVERISGKLNPWSVRIKGGAGAEAYISQKVDKADSLLSPKQYVVLEVDAMLESGTFAGSGVIIRVFNDDGTTKKDFFLKFSESVTTAQVPAGDGVVGQEYSWRFVIQLDVSTLTNGYAVYAASHSSLLGDISTANSVVFRRVGLRAASSGEAASDATVGQALKDLTATVNSYSGTLATLSGRTKAYWGVDVNAGSNAAAFITANAEISDGQITSDISLGAREFHVYNQTAGSWSKALSVANGDVQIYGKLQIGAVARSMIQNGAVTIEKLPSSIRRFTSNGLKIRIDANGKFVWDAGSITVIGDDLVPNTYPISAGESTNKYLVYRVGDATFASSNNTSVLTDGSILIAVWNGGTDLQVTSGGGTMINGDSIVTGTVSAETIKAGTILSGTIKVSGTSGDNSLNNAFNTATWTGVSGSGKPETYTVMARGNKTTDLPANYAHGLRDANGNGFVDSLSPALRSDAYERSFTVCWRISPTYWAVRFFDVYGNTPYTDDSDRQGATGLAALLNSLANGTPVVVYTSDEPSFNRLTGGLPEAMYRMGASRTNFAGPLWKGFDSYILIGLAGAGEGNGLELFSPGGTKSYVATAFSIVNGLPVVGGKSIRDASDLMFSDGRLVNDLYQVEAQATKGAPAGTVVGSTPSTLVEARAANSANVSFKFLNDGDIVTEGNRVKRVSGSGWNHAIYTQEYSTGSARISGTLETSETFLGLNEYDQNLNASFNTVHYGFHYSGGDGKWHIYEGGTRIIDLGTTYNGVIFDTNTLFSVIYDGKSVKYYANGVLLRAVDTFANRLFCGAILLAYINCSVSKVSFSAFTDNSLVNADPAARINQASTTIDPGKILIAGTTRLSDWRNGQDTTKIEGGNIAANTISANKLTIGQRGIDISGIEFTANWNTNVAQTNWFSWTGGVIRYVDTNGNNVTQNIVAGAAGLVGANTFAAWTPGSNFLNVQNDRNAYNANYVILAVYAGGTDLVVNYGRTIIDGSKITTGTIQAQQIAAGAIKAEQIAANSISASKLLITDTTVFAENWDLAVFGVGWAQQTNSGSGPIWRSDATKAWRGSNYFEMLGQGGVRNKAVMRVSPGDPLYAYGYVNSTASGSDQNYIFIRISYVDANDNEIRTWGSPRAVGGSSRYGVYEKLTVTDVAPANAVGAKVECFYSSNGTGELFFGGGGLMRRASGELIVDGAITADKISASAVTAGKLVASARPFSIAGLNMRIDADGVCRWDNAIATYVDGGGTLVTRNITADSRSWTGSVGRFYFYVGDGATNTNLDFFANGNLGLEPNVLYQRVAIWDAPSSITVMAGGSTVINGDKIVTGTIKAQAIAAGTITGDKIAANTISTRSLAIGNFDNIIPDGAMRDVAFWNGLANAGSGTGVTTVEVKDQNSLWRFGRTMIIHGPVDAAWLTPFFNVEIGATYKLDYQIYFSPDFNGWLNITLHHPGLYWRSIKTNFAGIDPTANYTNVEGHTFHAGDTTANPSPCIFTIAPEQNNSTRQTQIRFDAHWTTGYVEFMVNIVRVSDTTLIKDGSITTNKVAANAITANQLSVSTRPVSTFGMSFRVDNDNKLRWEPGYVQYTDNNGSYVSASVLSGEVAYSGSTVFLYYRPGRGVIDYTLTEQIQNDQSVSFLGKWHGSKSSLNMSSGVGTYLNGEQIVTGSIIADKIAAGSITTEKLSVTPYGGALNSNPYVNDNSAWFGIGGGAGVKTIGDGKTGVYVMEISGANNSVVEKRSVPFDPSKQYVFRCLARRASGGTTSVIFAGVAVFDANGTNITGDGSYWYYVASGVNVGSEWTQFTGYFGAGKRTFPSNAKTMAVCLFGNYGGNYDSVHQFQDVRIEEVLPGTLIQDGVITTDKIAANTITANKLVVASRPVSSSELNLNYKDGLLSWDAGNIVSVDANGGTAVYRVRSGSVRGAGYLLYLPGNDYLDYNPDPVYVANSSFIKIAYYDGGQRLNLIAGVSTTINGNNIVTGTISSDKITARTIEAGNIKAGTISGNEIAANTISTNNLVVASRPVSMSGVNMRITTDGVLRWDAGTVRIVNTVGSTDTYNVSGGETGSQDCMIVYVPGRSYFDVVGDRNVFLPNSEHIKIADRSGFSDLKVYAGVSTILSGDRIVTGSINADKIVANSITASQIATGALTARVLSVGNPDNIIGDSGYNDPTWWNGGNADSRLTVGESGMIEVGRELKIVSNSGRTDYYSMFFPVELGATYRVSIGVYTYGDFSGKFRPVIHMPNWAWLSLKLGVGINPEDAGDNVNYTSATTYYRNEFTITNPLATLECRKWQFRLIGDWNGTLAFVCKIVRVSDTTLIKDGSITTDKIVANAVKANQIDANAITADKISAGAITTDKLTIGLKSQSVKNYLDVSFWGNAAITGQPNWSPNNDSANFWYLGTGPQGSEMLLRMRANGANNNGGWDVSFTQANGFSRDKMYRYYTWYNAANDGVSNSIYHGTGNVQNIQGGDNTNPYFFVFDKNSLQRDKWYLMVGVVHPANTEHADTGISGVYDPVSGQRVINGQDYRWSPNATSGSFRSYQFYGQLNGQAYFTRPVVEEVVSGQTSSIKALMQQLDFGSVVNSGSTLIRPGLIQISGGTTIENWKNGGDSTEIRGGAVAANTITANKLTIGNRNISVIGCDFEYNPSNGQLTWRDGHILYTDDSGNPSSPYIPAGSVAWNGGSYNYIVWDKGATGFRQTPPDNWEPSQNANSNSIIMCTWRNGVNFVANYGGTIVNGDRITTGSINADRIKANTVLASTIQVNGKGNLDSAWSYATWGGVTGNGKPMTYTVGARGNQTSALPPGFTQGLRGPDGQVYADGSYPSLRSDAYNRSYTVCWTGGGDVWGIRHFDVYGGGSVNYGGGYGSDAGSMAQLLRDIAFGSTIVIYTSDEPSNMRLNGGLPLEMYNCGASKSVFGSSNFPNHSSYILIGQKGIGEGNGFELFSPGGSASYVRTSFSIINGVPSVGGQSIKDARDLVFSNGRGLENLIDVQNGATLGAPSGTYVGNTEAQAVANNAATGASDPAGRINRGETTTIDGGRITTGTVTANQIAANTITANKLVVGSRGISWIGLNFEYNPTNGWIYWSNGYLYYQDDNGGARSQYINEGNSGGAAPHLFFFWVKDSASVQITRSEQEAYGYTDRVMLGSWWGGSNLNMTYGGTIINGDRITTGTINADRIMAGTVLANNIIISGTNTSLGTVNAVVSDPAYYINQNQTTINGGKITAYSITGTQIQAHSITSTEIAAQTITSTEIKAGSINADRLSVTSLSAITANIGTLRTSASGLRTEIDNNGMRTYNSNGNLVFQCGIY